MQPIRNEILKKQKILDNAKEILKQEFVGIDSVIDEVVDAVSSWFLFPDLQEKPVVVNLWGLTGVGKSSLVVRLAQLIDFENRFYQFDLGETENSDWEVRGQLEKIYENDNGYPVLLAFDEFQHARTLNALGGEIDKSASRIVWQLLDSGKFQISRSTYCLDRIYDIMEQLRYLLRNGVRVEKGKVVSSKEYFVNKLDLSSDYEKRRGFKVSLDLSDVPFFPVSNHDDIFSLTKDKFSTEFEVIEKLMTLNGRETIEFLQDVISMANSPKPIDCSKGLIFVLGNLDEAYAMTHDFNPDMDADEIHEQSLEINVPIIKQALQRRFRNEQIARLGNLHIIYPAFSKKSFQEIIKLELSKIVEKVWNQQKIRLSFDASVHELIYREGVYPTQGTRPIFSTIHQIVNTKLGRVLSEMIGKDLDVSTILFRAHGNFITTDYFKGKKKIHSLMIAQPLNLEKLRTNKQDDEQAITAVHESGHAIIAAILLNTVPEVAFSNAVEAGTGGFVFTKFMWNYVSRKEITKRLALFLGGLAAEKIVFGEENVTTGAENDIEKATEFITQMLKQCGMGKLPAAYHNEDTDTRSYLYDKAGELCEDAEAWIAKAFTLAEKTLKEQEVLLLKMAAYLGDNRELRKPQIVEMLKTYACDFNADASIENGDLLFYREHLKKKVEALENGTNIQSFEGGRSSEEAPCYPIPMAK